MLRITLPVATDDQPLNDYKYVLLVTLWIAFQCYLTGFILVEGKRIKLYTEDYLKKNYLEEHQKAFPNDKRVPKLGYPDMGNGWYSSKLTYKEWFEFNIVQRIHMNFLEQLMIVSFLLLTAGLKHPVYTVYAGVAYAVGRVIQVFGYKRSVDGRKPGGLVFILSLLALFGMSAHSLWTLA